MELEEMRLIANESSKLYKERVKKYHDKKLLKKDFQPSQQVLLSIQGLNCFLGSSNLNGPDHLPSRESDHTEQWSFMTLKLKISTEHGW